MGSSGVIDRRPFRPELLGHLLTGSHLTPPPGVKSWEVPVPRQFLFRSRLSYGSRACLATNEEEPKSMNPHKIVSIAREGVNNSLRFVSAVRLS